MGMRRLNSLLSAGQQNVEKAACMRHFLIYSTCCCASTHLAAMQGTYPGLEQEQESPNFGARPVQLRWPSRFPAGSLPEGRQADPGECNHTGGCCAAGAALPALTRVDRLLPTASHHYLPSLASAGTSAGMPGPGFTDSGVQQPRKRGLFGSAALSGPAPPSSPSAWEDAGAAEPTISALHPADSAPTVDGPAPKRARLAAGRGGAQLSAGWALTAASGAADSDSDGEDAVLSCRHPTPDKTLATMAAPTVRVSAQHPPPTWAASLHPPEQQASERLVGAGRRASLWPAAGSQCSPEPSEYCKAIRLIAGLTLLSSSLQAVSAAVLPRRTAAVDAEAQQDEWCGGSAMEEDDCRGWADWQRFPLPLFNDVEE